MIKKLSNLLIANLDKILPALFLVGCIYGFFFGWEEVTVIYLATCGGLFIIAFLVWLFTELPKKINNKLKTEREKLRLNPNPTVSIFEINGNKISSAKNLFYSDNFNDIYSIFDFNQTPTLLRESSQNGNLTFFNGQIIKLENKKYLIEKFW